MSDTQQAVHDYQALKRRGDDANRIIILLVETQGCFNFTEMDVGRLKSWPKPFKFSLLLFLAALLFCFALFYIYNIDKRR